MKFTLTYEGPLPSSQRKAKNASDTKALRIWPIRQQIHPQLVELWRTHPALVRLAENSSVFKGPGMTLEPHHSTKDAQRQSIRGFDAGRPDNLGQEKIDTCAPIAKGNHLFRPLVRNTLSLMCGVKLLFLRREEPGRVYPNGDLDNRIKTLLDGLAMPQHREQIPPEAAIEAGGLHCLCEDDSLISGIAIESGRLLTPTISPDDVRVIIEVDVRVTDARHYNLLFLGD